MKAKRIIALVLTLVLVSMCAACTPTFKIKINVGDASGMAAGGAAGGSSAGGAAGGTGENVNPNTPPPSDQNEVVDDSSKEAGLATKEDIVKFYCDAYNKLGEASAITKTYDYTSNYNGIVNVNGNSTLEGIAKTLMTQFMVENTEAHAVSVKDMPPVGSETINIDPNLIQSATCKDMGDYYEITLYSTGTDDNYEIDSQPVTGSAGSFGPLLRSEDVAGAAGSMIQFEGLHSWYATASVTAKITKDGKITDLEYFTPCVLHFDQVVAAIVVKIKNCEVGLLFHQIYTVAY